MYNDPARGPEDLLDPDNLDVAAFMADYGHVFERNRPSTQRKSSGSSGRWSFSLNKLLIALAILLAAGPISTVIFFIAALIF